MKKFICCILVLIMLFPMGTVCFAEKGDYGFYTVLVKKSIELLQQGKYSEIINIMDQSIIDKLNSDYNNPKNPEYVKKIISDLLTSHKCVCKVSLIEEQIKKGEFLEAYILIDDDIIDFYRDLIYNPTVSKTEEEKLKLVTNLQNALNFAAENDGTNLSAVSKSFVENKFSQFKQHTEKSLAYFLCRWGYCYTLSVNKGFMTSDTTNFETVKKMLTANYGF